MFAFFACVHVRVFTVTQTALMSAAVTILASDMGLCHGQPNHGLHTSGKNKPLLASSPAISGRNCRLRDVSGRRFREKLIWQMSSVLFGNESLRRRLSPWIWCMTWASVCYWSAAISWQSQRRRESGGKAQSRPVLINKDLHWTWN